MSSTSHWEADIAALLAELSATQGETLDLLTEKRRLLVAYDQVGLAAIAEREERAMARLQACLERRGELLEQAAGEGLPHASIRELTDSLSHADRARLGPQVLQASSRARILQHQSITNWVLVQRSLLHLSQMLEIIATGGRSQPTYGKSDSAGSSGALVDQAA